jgi:uncharacterized protein YfkK (UPF0435 family)
MASEPNRERLLQAVENIRNKTNLVEVDLDQLE